MSHKKQLEARLSLAQGREVVRLARETLDSFVNQGELTRAPNRGGYLAEKKGVFVTLNLAGEGQERLRGCIGFPYPVKPLAEAVLEATVSASSEDPRFPAVRQEELDNILVEVSVLTVPVTIDIRRRQEMPAEVKVGEDGLIVSNAYTTGLLLPQVATEYGMDSEEFLCQACLKAGIPPDSWLQTSTTVQTFRADVFAETTPRGEVEKVELGAT